MKESPGVSRRAIEKQVKKLRENGKIHRVGTDKSGTWEVVENGSSMAVSGPKNGRKASATSSSFAFWW